MWRQISLPTERNISIKFLVTIPFCLWNPWLHQKLNSSTILNVNDLFLNPAGQDGTVYVCYPEARLRGKNHCFPNLIYFSECLFTSSSFSPFQGGLRCTSMKLDVVFTAESPLWAIMSLSVHPQCKNGPWSTANGWWIKKSVLRNTP